MFKPHKSRYLRILGCLIPLVGCSQPALEGPQVEGLPAGFVMDANSSSARKVFQENGLLDQFGYFTMGEDTHCSIMVTTYEGVKTYEDALAAREYWAERYPRSVYTEVEALAIDGRTAWGWFHPQGRKGETSSRKFIAVIPYEEDDLTYAVEFYASDPRYMDEQYLVDTVKRFTVKRTGVSYGAVGFGVLVLGGLAAAFARMGKK